jgi:flagellar hook-associated protein 2
LVITAKATGTGGTVGKVSLADITNSATSANNLGILAGTLDDPVNPTKIASGGLTSTGTGIATDANFTLNGINLTRSTNVVKDAVDGLTITLKQGGQVGTTTLTVGQDTAGATTALQSVITNYNKLVTDYKTASTATKNADGSIALAPLSNDSTMRTLMNNLRAAMQGASAGQSSGATYKTLASLGVTSQPDGTLYLNSYTFQQAMSNDPASVQNLFAFSGTSTSPVVTVKSAGSQTATGSVDFAITDLGGGNLVGSLTQGTTTVASIPVINGVLAGTGIFAGLNLGVTGIGTGTLTLSRGAGQAASDLMSNYTGVSGNIANLLSTITSQNTNLVSQIASAQTRLNQETADLKDKFAQMEAIVGQMKATTGSLFGA